MPVVFSGFYGTIPNSRKRRCSNQKMLLIERSPKIKNFQREFIIMGSTGNIYNITIKDTPMCTCPDYVKRGNRCKHIYFVLVKIMRVSEINQEKDEYTKKDLVKMFNNIPKITKNLLASKDHINLYERKKKML